MNLFFDMEFTGLHKDTTPISIGIVSEDNQCFYAEFTDYDNSQCDEWIKENVIDNLFLTNRLIGIVNESIENNGNVIHIHNVRGNKHFISRELSKWLNRFQDIQFVSDVCHYDFVLLIDLITNGGTALELPSNISAVCHDINQDIAQYYCISDRSAFYMSREEIMRYVCPKKDFVRGDKHNSLYDAEVIRAIWKGINNKRAEMK